MTNVIHIIKNSLTQFKLFFDKYYFLTIWIIAKNNISRQYRDSFLGVVWTILQPLSQVLIYAIVMPRIMRSPVDNYITFLTSSLLLWQFISGCFVGNTNSIINQAETIKRCTISKTVFPLADVTRYLYTYIISFIAMYSVSVILSGFNSYVFLLPLYLIPILIIISSVSIALAFVAPYLRDLSDLMTVGMNISFWLTPIVYPVSSFSPEKQYLFEFNPFYIMIRPIAKLLHKQELPNMHDLNTLFGLMLISVILSYTIYRKCRKNFIYYL